MIGSSKRETNSLYIQHRWQPDKSRRYDGDEGFSDQQQDQHVIVQPQQTLNIDTLKKPNPKAKPRFHQPKIKLTFTGRDKGDIQKLKDRLHNNQTNNATRRTHHQSLEIKKRRPISPLNFFPTLTKTKRTLLGQNISSKDYCFQQIKAAKKILSNLGQNIQYQRKFDSNTHGYLKILQQRMKYQPYSFIKSKYNVLIRQKIRDSFVMPKAYQPAFGTIERQEIKIDADFESSNLQFATKVGEKEFDIYMSIDTNTKGHQNWFYFSIENTTQQETTVAINVCNFKREFRMLNKGAKVYARNLTTDQQTWYPAGQNITMRQNESQLFPGRLYKLSFNFTMKQNCKYELSLMPPFSYSRMLQEIEQLQKFDTVSIQMLTYSLTGLAIPILTIGKKPYQNKNVILVSGRIHPGQTVGSFMVKGLLQRLTKHATPQIQQLLQTTVIKVIPMINPDGVVFGNFRTNYLGNDLNRSFYTDDQILFPQVCALKALGAQLKSVYQNKFLMFLDLHGHSSKKNIFSYGPDFEAGSSNYYTSRLLPKVLHSKSKYFKYSSCTFKLEDYKQNTARGYFLNEMKVLGYTIEASYGMYDTSDKEQCCLKIEDWIKFGSQLAQSLAIVVKASAMSKIKTHSELKRIISQRQQDQIQFMKKLTKDIKKETQKSIRKQIILQVEQKGNANSDSDGQSEGEDLSMSERVQIEKKVIECSAPQFILPRMVKPAIVYPTVTPRLFQATEKQEGSIKLLYMKRNKYSAIRMMNISNTSSSLTTNLAKLDIFRPQAKNMKLEKRADYF